VTEGRVVIDGETVGEIQQGLLLLLGIHKEDQLRDADYLLEKCLNLRVFTDQNDKMNLSVLDIDGEVLVVSQFTLYADTRKGRRPGFSEAARPEVAIPLYRYFIKEVEDKLGKVAVGQFGADMKIDFTNDGPVTIMLDSEDKYPKQEIPNE
jgi:D-tyrosyl-tRNA(Tyr) deacylase